MTPPQELLCPVCSLEYSEQNPARILTLCGHTFCHRCIRSLITKKKQKLYKIKCPIDNKIIQVDKPTQDLFPKNINICKCIDKHKNKQSQQNQDQDQQNQFLNQSIVIKENKIEVNIDTKLNQSRDKEQISQQNISKQDQARIQHKKQQCLLHNKLLQLYCLQDRVYLCTDCVIFGQHRLHKVQTVHKLLQKQNNFIKQIKKIIKRKKQLQLKLSDKQIQNQVIDLLDNKKSILLKQISRQFNNIRQIVNQTQKNLIQQLQISTLNIAHRIKNKMKIQKYVDDQFKQWQLKTKQIIDGSNHKMNEINRKEIVGFVNLYDQKYKQFVQNGKFMLKEIQGQEKCLMENVEKEINQFRIQCNLLTLNQQIFKCFQIKQHTIQIQPLCFKQNQTQSYNHNLKTQSHNYSQKLSHRNQQQKTLKQTNQFEQQQSLLDFDRTNRLMLQSKIKLSQNNSIKQPMNSNELSTNKQSKISIRSNNTMVSPKLNKKVSNNLFSKTVNMDHNAKQKQPLRQKPIISNINNNRKSNNNTIKISKQKQNSVSSISSIQTPLNSRSHSSSSRSLHKNKSSSLLSSSNIKQFSPKYFSILSQLSTNKQVQFLDLSACQFHSSNILKLIKQCENSLNLKIIKLMRNNLDDEFIDQILKISRLLQFERINFAQNKFTQQSLVNMLNVFTLNKEILKIQYINFSQNRIVQRKNNKIVQQYKKLGITLVL